MKVLIVKRGKILKRAIKLFEDKNVVYVFENTVNGKLYVGISKDVSQRLRQHKTDCFTHKNNYILYKAIRKYGFNNFNVYIVCVTKKYEKLYALEVEYINKYCSMAPLGYNLKAGYGNKSLVSDKTRKKMRLSMQKTDKHHIKPISIRKDGRLFYTRIRSGGATYTKGFCSKKKAIEAYDKCVLFIYGKRAWINFPEKRKEYLKEDLNGFLESFKYGANNIYNPLGFCGLFKKGGKINVTVKNKKYGSYETKEEASLIRDKIVMFLDYGENHIRLNNTSLLNTITFKELKKFYTDTIKNISKTSKYVGVHFDKGRQRWAASYCNGAYKKFIGRYGSEKEAFLARKKFLKTLNN